MTITRPARANADTMPSLYDSGGNVVQLKRLTHHHHAIMDFMLANPTFTLDELAKHFKRTPAWVSTVRNSDLFQMRLKERRQLMDEDQAFRIGQKIAKVAEKGIEAMLDVVQDDEQDARVKLDATKTALEAIGFLGKGRTSSSDPAQAAAPVQVNIGMSVFEQAREKAIAGHQARPVLENEG